ncbi:hypothetical protein HOG16_01095 [Candidatus Woesearchaeota archaeon]|nr:hypothetical protein [Candidatus Woesearchaeota archaeon]MBT4322169.1 hypothetical protein [Candidatus Woesearchaeota archaeon]MBT4630917.1 hypothetical protein [Candidatus Woesearchaeota archaeon]
MMKVSNNSLAVLLTLAVVASISGTWFSVSFMDGITGAATTTGTVKLEVNYSTSCSATDSTINLGNISRGSSNWSESVTDYDFIVIENTGNVIQNVSGYATEDLFEMISAPTNNWTMQCNASQSGTCVTGYRIINASIGTAEYLVNNLAYATATDEFNVSVNATVPVDESSGMKTGTLTFVCIYSG